MAPDQGARRAKSSKSRSDVAPINPEDRWLIQFGFGGGGTLACAMLAMIIWLFVRHPAPRANPPAPVAQSHAEPAESPAEPPSTDSSDTAVAAAPAGTSTPPVAGDPPATVDPLAPFLRIELSVPATDFAFDTDHGHLALVGPWPNALGLITAEQLRDGASFADVANVPLPGTPTHVRHKPLSDGGLFVVGQRQPDSIVIIDPVSRAIVDTIPIESGAPCWLAGSPNPELPDVYVATIGAADTRSMTRIDARSRSITGTWEKAPLRDFEVSYSGADVYCRTFDSTPGRGLLHPDTSAQFDWNFNPERQYRDKDRRYHVDPHGRFVVTGNRVWSSDFLVRQPDLQFEAEAFLPDQPWTAGIEDSEFVVGSLNDGRIVHRVPLPAAWHRVQSPDHRHQQREQGLETWADLLGARTFADAPRDQFVLATGWRILTFPLDKLELPDEPLLLPADSAPSTAAAGSPFMFPIAPVSGDAVVELVSAPDGATMDGNTLHWTPQSADVGEHALAVRLIAGDVSHETRWKLQVRQKTLPLPFLVRGCDVSSDGARLVAWGHAWPARPLTPEERGSFQPEEWRLAIVNIADLQVLAEAPLDSPIRQAAFSGPEIVVSDPGQGTMRLIRLSSDDLRPLGEATVPGGPMTAIADQVLAVRVVGEALERQMHYFSLPDLKPRETLTDPSPVEVDHRVYTAYHDARRLAGGWLLDGAVWDDELKKPTLLIAPDGLLQVATTLLPSRPTIDMEPVLAGFVYDRVPTPQRRALPIGAAHEVDRDRLTFSPHIATELAVHANGPSAYLDDLGLAPEDPAHSIPLRIGGPSPTYPYFDPNDAQFATAAATAFVTLAGEVYVISLADRPAPFRIEPRQSTLELAASRPTRVTYAAEGATSYLLEIPALGTPGQPFHLESGDGAFRVEASDLNGLSKAVWQSVAQRGAGTALASEMDERVKRAGETYKRLINRRQPAGVPVSLDAYVQARREDGATAVLHHAYVLVIPTQIFTKNKP